MAAVLSSHDMWFEFGRSYFWLGITINRIIKISKFAVFPIISLNNARFRVISAQCGDSRFRGIPARWLHVELVFPQVSAGFPCRGHKHKGTAQFLSRKSRLISKIFPFRGNWES